MTDGKVRNILIVATSHDKLGTTGKTTGSWVEEVAAPYYAFKAKGYNVVIASIAGGVIPFDEASTSGDFCTEDAQKFLKDATAQKAVTESQAVDQFSMSSFDAIFVPGGHGIVFDGPNSKGLKKLLEDAYAQGKVISSVCHGPAGLVSAQTPEGKSIFHGKKVTGFSNSEEDAVGKTEAVRPVFLLEDKMKELGGHYSKGADWSSYAVTDGRLVTGQNPQSSKDVAEAVIAMLA